ncbi:peptidoglycan-binding domain-containing protein [Gemmobacter denitrificans]|uniref:Peptidoglycan-binding domain-containing protein n=1 Tax=Gemmobacter denitrificans TaxID=3123040 RepID=A0ABU8BSR6_9RHOB
MLPSVLPHRFATSLPRMVLAGVTALALASGATAPAEALGRDERNVLKGVVATLLIDAMLDEHRKSKKQKLHQYQPYPPQPVYRPQPPVHRPTIWQTPVAQAFNSYGYHDRQRIQQRLATYGYYRSRVDGSFGPSTYNAIVAYANDSGMGQSLHSQAGVYGVFDGLIY